MKENEQFKKTFSKLHASPDTIKEVLDMADNGTIQKTYKMCSLRIAAAVAIMILLFGSGTVVYAMNIGGIQNMIHLWIYGEKTDAVMTYEDQTQMITLRYKDKEGKEVKEDTPNCVGYNEDGSERTLTEKELWEFANAPQVEYLEDGKVMMYYLDQKKDITDKFKNDGYCHVHLDSSESSVCVTVDHEGNMSYSFYNIKKGHEPYEAHR